MVVELPSWVARGASFSVYYGPGNVNNRRYHVRGVVDETVVVLAQLGQRKCGLWGYETRDALWFTHNLERGIIRRVTWTTAT